VNPEQFLPCRWEVYYCIDFLLESISISSIRPFSWCLMIIYSTGAHTQGNQMTTAKNFSPFGGGIRHCVGSELSKVEAAFFLHHLVLSYRWRMDGEDVPMALPYVEFKRGLPIEIF
jgi:cytochrome P450